jgi:hypothetical protein
MLWIEDITILIEKKQQEGCEIILTGDFNEDLQDIKSSVNIMAKQLGLREALLDTYEVPSGFSTYARGTKVIDGVFLSQGLTLNNGGYTSNDSSPSDHQWIWFDVTVHQLVGTTLSERAQPLDRKATSTIPSVKERFNCLLNEQVAWHNLATKTKQLELSVHYQLEQHGQIDFITTTKIDQLNDILIRLVKTADKQCQKGQRGSIPSSPIVTNARGTIRILHLLCRRWKEKGKKSRPHMRRIQRLAKRYNYQGKMKYATLDEIQDNRRIALQRYKQMKPFAQDYRETFLGQIAEEKAQRDGKPIDFHFRLVMEQDEMRHQWHFDE